jgi:ribosomal protein S3
MVINKKPNGYVVTIKLNRNDSIVGHGKTKDEAIEAVVKSMAKKINSLEKEVKSMYNFQRYVRAVVTGEVGC